LTWFFLGARAEKSLFTATGGVKRAADNKNKPGGSASENHHSEGEIGLPGTKKYQ
jgi:hypothetical protein